MESLGFQLMGTIAGRFPIVGFVLLCLGTIFILVELFVRVTPKKEDDKWWASVLDGYFGRLIKEIMSFSPIKK